MRTWLRSKCACKAYRSLVRMFLIVGVLCLLAGWRGTGIVCLLIGSIGGGIAVLDVYQRHLLKQPRR
ncbi:hypothetical protein [Lacticaseibacillus zhaodongensis]|uniref:hypothetical protein n=1 Tax=Lacticaseibacillus zhaodongensis TaxID=2668065 RepID=UPI0012D345C3|nr:hypothetical protein [Lacticaseibacillus zhaodongensis]